MSTRDRFDEDANISRVIPPSSDEEEDVKEFLKKTKFEILAAYADPRTKFERREAANQAFRIRFGRDISRDDYPSPSNDSEADADSEATDSEADAQVGAQADDEVGAQVGAQADDEVGAQADDEADAQADEVVLFRCGNSKILCRLIDNSQKHDSDSSSDSSSNSSSDSEMDENPWRVYMYKGQPEIYRNC